MCTVHETLPTQRENAQPTGKQTWTHHSPRETRSSSRGTGAKPPHTRRDSRSPEHRHPQVQGPGCLGNLTCCRWGCRQVAPPRAVRGKKKQTKMHTGYNYPDPWGRERGLQSEKALGNVGLATERGVALTEGPFPTTLRRSVRSTTAPCLRELQRGRIPGCACGRHTRYFTPSSLCLRKTGRGRRPFSPWPGHRAPRSAGQGSARAAGPSRRSVWSPRAFLPEAQLPAGLVLRPASGRKERFLAPYHTAGWRGLTAGPAPTVQDPQGH